MNTNYLKYFIALYRTKNMHKAAQEMYISQQGLSRILQSLEKEWGTVFFQRSNQGMEPTKAGDYFYQKAVLLQNELLNTQRDLEIMKEGRKEIRLSLATGIIFKFYPVIEQYRKDNPNLQIRWFEVSERVAKRMLLSNEVDGAVLTDNEGSDPIMYLPLYKHEQYLLVYQGHPLYECNRISHTMLKDEALILESSNRKMITHFNRTCRKEGFVPNCIAQSSDTAFCYRLCSQKEGLVVTMDMGLEHKDYPNVRMIPFGDNGYVNQIYFARRNQAELDILDLEKAIRSMIQYENI